MSVSNFLLMHVFTALLPSPDAVDYEYYECLGISKHSSLEDIRKGYKKKSLELHPDKIAQRGKVDAATAAAQYERVQEASSVLQDKSKRKQYQGLGCSVARYRFLVSGGIYNPGAIMENLQHASFLNKTRLVLIVSIFFTIMLLQPILIAAKVNAVVDKNASDTDTDNMSMNMNMNTDDNNDSILQDTAWTIILIPLWILDGLFVVFWALLALMIPENAGEFTVTFLEHVSWLVGMILTAQQWDRSFEDKNNWHYTAAAFYVAIFFRIYGTQRAIGRRRSDQRRMVSPEYLTTLLSNHASTQEGEDWTEEQRSEFANKYIVVTVDSDAVVAAMEALGQDAEIGNMVTDEDLEALRVHSSQEFAEAEEQIKSLASSTTALLFYGVTFIALVASKLQGQIDTSWPIVFIPIFIKLGLEFCTSFLFCCCAGMLGSGAGNDDDIMVVLAGQDHVNGGDGNDEDNEDDGQEQGENKETSASADGAATKAPAKELKASLAPFAAPEGEIDDLNAPTTPSSSQVDGKKEAEKGRSANGNDETKTDEEANNNNNNNGADDDNDNDNFEDESEFKFDEDAYRAWHSAQAEVDASIMQARAKAQSTCCSASLQIIMIVLIVVKLEQDYEDVDGEDDNDGDTGFNAFWILSPVFVVAGLLLCCCSCLIYGVGAGGPEEDDMFEEHQDGGNYADNQETAQETNAPTSAAVAAEGKGSVDVSNPTASTSDAPTSDVEAGGGETMNDLD